MSRPTVPPPSVDPAPAGPDRGDRGGPESAGGTPALRLAAGVIAAQGLAALGLAAWLLISWRLDGVGRASDAAVLEVSLAVVGVLALVLAAGLRRAHRWARSAAFTGQIFVGVAGTEEITLGSPVVGWGLVAVAVVTAVLLVSPPVNRAVAVGH